MPVGWSANCADRFRRLRSHKTAAMMKITTRRIQSPIPIFASGERPVVEAVPPGVCDESVAYGPVVEKDWRRVVVLGWAVSVQIEVSGNE